MKFFPVSTLIAALFFVTACSESSIEEPEKPVEPVDKTAITYKSCLDEMRIDAEAQTVEINFKINEAWTATVSSRNWCEIDPSTVSGAKGSGKIRLVFQDNTQSASRQAVVKIKAEGYDEEKLCTFIQAGQSGDYNYNKNYLNAYLEERYLWNDEYKTLKRNYDQSYSDFLKNTLSSMTTNTLDGHTTNGKRSLYSYISRTPVSKAQHISTRASESDKVVSFGVDRITKIIYTSGGVATGKYGIRPAVIYPGSPAAEAGLTRGMTITAINGEQLTDANFSKYSSGLASPSNGLTYTVTVGTKTYRMTARKIFETPILKADVITDYSGHRIGHLVLQAFNLTFDNELKAVFRDFKSRGITDLIVDLRINGGGHVRTSQMLASCVAGSQHNGKIFEISRENDEIMRKKGYDITNKEDLATILSWGHRIFGPNDPNTSDRSQYATSDQIETLSRVYVIISSGTASASELFINSLRGIDFPVILIGDKNSTGKNVGMVAKSHTVGGYVYTVTPITFQSYNAKGYTGYGTVGFAPDYLVAGSNDDWGSASDTPFLKAIDLITGSRLSLAAQTRKAGEPAYLEEEIPSPRPRMEDMIVIPASEE